MSTVKSFSVGNGDMFYINHNSDNFTIIDCCFDDEKEKKKIFDEIKEIKKSKGITRFISTHPDNDHIKGLNDFKDEIGIENFYCVQNNAKKEDKTPDFETYTLLRDGNKHFYLSKGVQRKWMNLSDETRGNSGINCEWPVLSNKYFIEQLEKVENKESPNNISPIITYTIKDSASFMWMGDLEEEFMIQIEDELFKLPQVDVLFAPHHGRKSGVVPKKILDRINPKVIIIGEASSDYLHYYPENNKITQNSAEEILMECIDDYIHFYVSNCNYKVEFLTNLSKTNFDSNYYIGSLKVK